MTDATARARYGCVVFDVDSTLSAIEGIDWLAARRDEAVATEIRVMTERAMAGLVPLEEVYAFRLDRIRPTRSEIAELAQAYIDAVQPGARDLCEELDAAGCSVILLSGGIRQAILPLARHLRVAADDVHAVEISFGTDGVCDGLRGPQALATQHGKPAVLHGMREELERPIVMIGDGSTDAAARGVADAFIAFTGVTRRANVVAVADAEASDFGALHSLLFESAR